MEKDDIDDIADIDDIREIDEPGEIELVADFANNQPSCTGVPTSSDKEALIADPETDKILETIASSAAWHFHQEKEEVKQNLRIKIWRKFETVRDPASLPGWASRVAKNLGINAVKHQNVERSYLERKVHEANESTSYNGKPLVKSSTVPTPEDELLQRELEQQVIEAIAAATRNSPEWFASAYDPEKSAKEIKAETGQPLATIYRHMRSVQERLVMELEKRGIGPYGMH